MKGFSEEIYQLIFLWLMKDDNIYGYKLAKRFERMTRGHIKVSFGTVYPILRQMENKGLIKSTKHKNSERVYYNFTEEGKHQLNQLSDKINEFQVVLDDKLLGFLAIYREFYGHESLKKLLEKFNNISNKES